MSDRPKVEPLTLSPERVAEILSGNPIIDAETAAALLRYHGHKMTAAHLKSLGPRSGLSYLTGGRLGASRGYIPAHLLWWATNIMNKPKRKN